MNALILTLALRFAGGTLTSTAPGPLPATPPAPLPARAARSPLQAIQWSPGARLLRAPVVPPHDEALRYDIRYGILGSIGSMRVASGALAGRVGGASAVRVQGTGTGSILGLGSMQSQMDAVFDAGLRGSRRWTSARGAAGAQTIDTGSWEAGRAHLVRRKAGKPDEAYHFVALQTCDPLGWLWRLRTSPPPPGGSDAIQVVDGLALWRVRVTTVATAAAVPDADPTVAALRLEGDITPLYYDGRPDPDRKTRRFTLWLDRRAGHVPLRVAIPLGPADLVIRLVGS